MEPVIKSSLPQSPLIAIRMETKKERHPVRYGMTLFFFQEPLAEQLFQGICTTSPGKIVVEFSELADMIDSTVTPCILLIP